MPETKLDRLQSALMTSGLQTKDNSLYQVIWQLIKYLRQLQLEVGTLASSSSGGGNTEIRNITNILEGTTGEDGSIGPPGVNGIQGIAGGAGPQGPAGLTYVLEQIEAELPEMGPQGVQGPKGDTGAAGAGGAWTFIATNNIAAPTANLDYIDLDPYNEILVIIRNITASSSGTRQLLVSTDNGATFLTTSGDYRTISQAGVESNNTAIGFHLTPATTVKSGWAIISNFNVATYPKIVDPVLINEKIFIPTTSALNAVRVLNSAGNMTAGDVYVFGR